MPIAIALLSLLLMGYSSAARFEMDAQLGGGGGYTYTGSQTSHWMSCATCHEPKGEPAVVEIRTEPSQLLQKGYVPDTQYILYISLPDEQLGLEFNGGCISEGAWCNRNGIALEMLVQGDRPAGVLCPSASDMEEGVCTNNTGPSGSLINDGIAIVGQTLDFPTICGEQEQPGTVQSTPDDCIDIPALAEKGLNQEEIEQTIASKVRGKSNWTLAWKAPKAGTGYVGLFLGAVDGNGGRTYDPYYSDYVDDGVKMVRYELPEVGGNPDAIPWVEEFAGARLGDDDGCTISKRSKDGTMHLILIWVLFFSVLRRRPCAA